MKSNSLPERIALIEFDSSHDECLLTQVNALKKHGCWLVLITNDVLRKRNAYLESLVDEWWKIDPRDVGLNGAAIGDALIIRRLMQRLKKEKIDRVVFNTAQGGHVRNACLFSLFRKIECVGIVHTIRKFQGSFTQRVIGLKIKKYFVLGDFLISAVISAPLRQAQSSALNHRQVVTPQAERSRSLRNQVQIESFYPLDFPISDQKTASNEHIHIALIGSVETRRKDLDGFVSMIQQCDESVHFSFLGKADPSNADVIELKKKLAALNRLENVKFYEKHVPFEIIDQVLRKSTAILPLVHPNTSSATEYFRHQIPGAMNIALGYKIPLLLHESYRTIEELKTASIYYELNSFSSALTELTSNGKTIREKMKTHENYSSKIQQQKYLDFIFDDRG